MSCKALAVKPGSISYGMIPSGQRYSPPSGERLLLAGKLPETALPDLHLRVASTTSSAVPSTMSPSWIAMPSMTL